MRHLGECKGGSARWFGYVERREGSEIKESYYGGRARWFGQVERREGSEALGRAGKVEVQGGLGMWRRE